MTEATTDYHPMWKALGLDPTAPASLPTRVGWTTFCAPYQIEATAVASAAQAADIRTLHIDTDYSAGDVGQLSTCVEAFLEMLE